MSLTGQIVLCGIVRATVTLPYPSIFKRQNASIASLSLPSCPLLSIICKTAGVEHTHELTQLIWWYTKSYYIKHHNIIAGSCIAGSWRGQESSVLYAECSSLHASRPKHSPKCKGMTPQHNANEITLTSSKPSRVHRTQDEARLQKQARYLTEGEVTQETD